MAGLAIVLPIVLNLRHSLEFYPHYFVNVLPLPDNKLKVTGNTKLKMTDFKVEPPSPKIALGLIKTGDEVKLIQGQTPSIAAAALQTGLKNIITARGGTIASERNEQPEDYEETLIELEVNGEISLETRRRLATAPAPA